MERFKAKLQPVAPGGQFVVVAGAVVAAAGLKYGARDAGAPDRRHGRGVALQAIVERRRGRSGVEAAAPADYNSGSC